MVPDNQPEDASDAPSAPLTKPLSSNRCGFWLPVLALVLLTCAAYIPALHNGFIWDDDDHLTNNAAVASPDGLQRIWSSLSVSRYYPLTLTTFWLERQLWGLDPLPYHAVNILFHAVNAVLLLFLLRQLKVYGAWVVAAVWAVHPVNVESVAWVTELKNTQSGLFFFLCLFCFIQFEQHKQRRWYILAMLAFVAALLSKPSTVFLPAVLLLYAWWRHGACRLADGLRAIPFFAMAIAMSLLTIVEQQHNIGNGDSGEWSLSFMQRILIASRALWFYAGKILCPTSLAFVYPRWDTRVTDSACWLPLLAILPVMVLLAIQRRQPSVRALLFGLGYFALALAPVLGFVNVYYFRYSFVADHFDYLPSIGLIALATVGLASYFRSSLVKSAMATSAIACFALLTWQRAQVFCDNETLWRDTLQQNPTSTLALNNLGNILQNQDKLTDAESHLRQAIQLQPDYPQVHNNLGVVLAKQGRRDEAIQHFAAALRLQPKYPEAEDNIARLLAEENRLDEAIPHLQRFVELRPDLAEGYLKLGELLRRRHRDAQAIAVYRRGVQVLPDHLHLANELAWTLVTSPDPQLRDPSSAIPLAEHIVTRTKHRAAEPLDTLAAACAAAGRFDEAAAIAEEARAICLRQNQPAAAAAIATRIQMYKDHHPWQQNFPL